jgi:hypothetical protein
MHEDQLAALRLEFFKIGRIGTADPGQLLVDRVHVMVEIEGQPVEIVTEDPVYQGIR